MLLVYGQKRGGEKLVRESVEKTTLIGWVGDQTEKDYTKETLESRFRLVGRGIKIPVKCVERLKKRIREIWMFTI